MASSLIANFVSGGLAASKPAAPTQPANVILMYYATDTGKLFLFVNGSWIQYN